MKAKDLFALLKKLNIELAYYEFTKRPTSDSWLVYYESSKDTFLADNKVYAYEPRYNIELYSKKKNIALEEKLLKLLEDNNIAWSGGETTKLDEENIYLTTFYI